MRDDASIFWQMSSEVRDAASPAQRRAQRGKPSPAQSATRQLSPARAAPGATNDGGRPAHRGLCPDPYQITILILILILTSA
jgi:hypothetical protein